MTRAEATAEKPGPKKGTKPSRNTVHERRRQFTGEYRPYRERMERFGPDYKLRYRLSPTNSRAVTGLEDFSKWDDEELARGRRRAKDGSFKGRDPKLIPNGAQKELARRKVLEANQKLAEATPELVQSLIDIATGEEYDEKARVAAIKEALERTIGKAAEQVHITVETKPWEHALQNAVVVVGTESDEDVRPALEAPEDIVDAELVDEDDDPEIWDDEEVA